MLHLHLLGSPQIILDGQTVSDLSSAKSQALLFYLAMHDRAQSRLALGGLLWPDKSDKEARMNLRQALYQLRLVLPDYIQATRQDVILNRTTDLVVDVALFERELKPGLVGDMEKLQAAVDYYHHEFLSGFYVDDAPEFEEWQLMERERLRSLAIQAMHRLSSYYVQRRAVGPGLLVTRRLLDIEPWREESHQLLMRLLAWDGQITAALIQYEQCRQLLADELDVEPSEETEALLAQIKARNAEDREPKVDVASDVINHVPMPVMAASSSLPQAPTLFIGRNQELSEMAELIAQPGIRLLSIVAPGGMGKTRLALAYAERALLDGVFVDGVYFVPLEGIEAVNESALADHISLAIVCASGLSLRAEASTLSQHLLAVLRQKRMLLILDNFEHVLAGAGFVSDLLQSAPFLHIVVTSRERLNLYGEQVLTLKGLALPDVEAKDDIVVYTDALQLFIQAARRVRHNFEPQPEERPALIELCHFLAGMPLAIELAASWVESLAVTEILAELRQDLDLLSTELRDVATRQRSVREVFVHAWQRLPLEEQQALAALSVFRGGFTRAAAQQVAFDHTHLPTTLRLLADMVQRSLLHYDRVKNRYEMHGLLRQFAREKLEQTSKGSTNVYQRHSTYFCEFLQVRETAFYSQQQQATLLETEADIENIRIAWQWAAANGEIACLGQALSALFYFYDVRSWFREGERVFRETADSLPLPATHEERITLARLRARQGWFTFHLGQQQESLRLLEDSLFQLERLRAWADTIFNYNYLGAVLRHQGKYKQANVYLLKALELARNFADHYQASISLNILGQTVSLQGDYGLARYYCQEGLRLKRTLGDQRGQTYSLTYLGRIAKALGDYEEAHQLFQESMTISEAVGDQRGVALAFQNLGDVFLAQRRFQESAEMFKQGLTIFRKIGNRHGESLCLIDLGKTKAAAGQLATAAELIREGGQIALDLSLQPGLEATIRAMASVWRQTGDAERSQAALAFLELKQLSPDEQMTQLQLEMTKPLILFKSLPEDASTFVRDYLIT